MRYVVKIMTLNGVVCTVMSYNKARKLEEDIKNNHTDVDVEIYKFSDYVKLHNDFADEYNAVLRDWIEQ